MGGSGARVLVGGLLMLALAPHVVHAQAEDGPPLEEGPAVLEPGPPAAPDDAAPAVTLPEGLEADLSGPSPFSAALATAVTGGTFGICHGVGGALVVVYGGFATLWLTGLSLASTSCFSALFCGPLYVSALGLWLGTVFPLCAGCLNVPPSAAAGPMSWGLSTLAARRRLPLVPVMLSTVAPGLACWGTACAGSGVLTTVGALMGAVSWLYWVHALFRQVTLPAQSAEQALWYSLGTAAAAVGVLAGAAVLFTCVNGAGHVLNAMGAGATAGLLGRRRPPNEGPFNLDLWQVPDPEPLWGPRHGTQAPGTPGTPSPPPAAEEPSHPAQPDAPESIIPREPAPPDAAEPAEPPAAQPF